MISLKQRRRPFSSNPLNRQQRRFSLPRKKNIEHIQLYTVELHAIMVKASRVLKRMSVEFGSDEVVKKFSQFSEAIDSPDNLAKFLTEEGLHSDFVLKKNGQVVSLTFVGSSVFLGKRIHYGKGFISAVYFPTAPFCL